MAVALKEKNTQPAIKVLAGDADAQTVATAIQSFVQSGLIIIPEGVNPSKLENLIFTINRNDKGEILGANVLAKVRT